jgi:hypothetical protein
VKTLDVQARLTLLAAAVAICFAGPSSAGPKAKTPGELLMECIKNVAKVRPGMTAAEVLTVVCRPDHINSTVTLNGKREQWVYPDVFDTRRGNQYLYFEDGRVVAVQSHN